MNTHPPSRRTVIVQRHGSPSRTHERLLGLWLGHTHLQILFMNHLRLSCQNATAFQRRCSANDMMVACSWQRSPRGRGGIYNRDEQTCRQGRCRKQTGDPFIAVQLTFILQLLFMAHNALLLLRQIPGKWKFRQVHDLN